MDKFQLRHFDYLLEIDSLPAGKQARYPLNLDTDSSFILRGRAVYAEAAAGGLAGQVALLTNYFDRYTGPDNDDLADGLTRFYNESRVLGQYGLFLPVRPPMIYPPGGTIYVDVRNDGATELEELQLYFRGQKVFAPGSLPCYTYPEPCIARPYWFPTGGSAGPQVLTLPVDVLLLNNIFRVNSYADFVLRSLCGGTFGPNEYRGIYIHLKDQDGRAYSNMPVHLDVCYGAYGSIVGSGNAARVYGNQLPPLLAPEIYIPATQFLTFDIERDDYGGGGGPVDLQLCWGGAQIWKGER